MKTPKFQKNSNVEFNYIWSFSECINFWTCCSSANPCQDKEGDCDTNADCIDDLTCGIRNCGPLYPANSDCCESEGRLKMSQTESQLGWSLFNPSYKIIKDLQRLISHLRIGSRYQAEVYIKHTASQ